MASYWLGVSYEQKSLCTFPQLLLNGKEKFSRQLTSLTILPINIAISTSMKVRSFKLDLTYRFISDECSLDFTDSDDRKETSHGCG